MRNRDGAKPERLAVFLIESYSFLSYLLLSVSPYPCPVPSCHSFPPSTLYRLVLTIPSRTLTHPVITTYNYTQTTPSRSPSSVLPSISSPCILCIPQSEYHLWYSLLWSDPVHVLSLTHPQLAHLWPSSSSMTLMPPSTFSHLQQGPTYVTDTGRCPMPCPNPKEVVRTRAAIPLLFPIGHVPFFLGLLGLAPCASAFPRSGVRNHWTLGVL